MHDARWACKQQVGWAQVARCLCVQQHALGVLAQRLLHHMGLVAIPDARQNAQLQGLGDGCCQRQRQNLRRPPSSITPVDDRTMTRAFVQSRRLRRLVARMEAAMWDLSAAQTPLACSRNRLGRAFPTLQAEGWTSMGNRTGS